MGAPQSPIGNVHSGGIGNANAESAEGAKIAAEHCASCHAIGRTGSSSHPAAPLFRKLEQNYGLDQLKDLLEAGTLIATHPEMPSFKLRPRESRVLFDYLRSIEE